MRVISVALCAVALACGDRVPLPAAERSWPDLTAKERDARMCDALGAEPRRIRVGDAVLRFIDVGPRRVGADAGAGGGAESAPPWLFVHGFGGSIGDFAPLVIRLSETRRVLAVDLPGFGDSVTSGNDTSIEFLADLVERFAHAVAAERADLVCHSLGGHVCLALAIRGARFVESLTLIDAAGVYERASFVERATKTFGHVNIGEVVTAPGRSALDVPEGDRAIFRRFVSEDRETLTALESFRADYRGEVPRIGVPTRIIWGTRDTVFPIESAFFLAENIEGARLYLVEGAGHAPQLSHPEIVLRWLEESESRGGEDGGR